MAIVFAVLSVLAIIVGLFLPPLRRKQRAIPALYGLTLVILCYSITLYDKKTDRIASIESAAAKMLKEQNQSYTHLGFIHASLVFLEKNKDLYPDTYKRASRLCVQYQCDSPRGNIKEMPNLALAMSGLLSGLTTLNRF